MEQICLRLRMILYHFTYNTRLSLSTVLVYWKQIQPIEIQQSAQIERES